MSVNWHDVATITVTMIALGGVMVALLRGFFQTKKDCELDQDKCQLAVCRKIDELKKDIKDDRVIANEHYIEIKEALAEMRGKF